MYISLLGALRSRATGACLKEQKENILLTSFTVFSPQVTAASCKLERQLGQLHVAVTASEGESGLPVWRATWWKVLILGDRAGALYNHSVAQNRNQFVVDGLTLQLLN